MNRPTCSSIEACPAQEYSQTRRRFLADHWPTKDNGQIVEAPGEAWLRVEVALRIGGRGLSGRSSLARLLDETVRCAGLGSVRSAILT